MKKFVLAAMLLGLTVGSSYVSATPVYAEAQNGIPESHVSILLEESANFFAITLEEATQAYEVGGLIIRQIGKNSYRVEFGSGWGDFLIEPTL